MESMAFATRWWENGGTKESKASITRAVNDGYTHGRLCAVYKGYVQTKAQQYLHNIMQLLYI